MHDILINAHLFKMIIHCAHYLRFNRFITSPGLNKIFLVLGLLKNLKFKSIKSTVKHGNSNW